MAVQININLNASVYSLLENTSDHRETINTVHTMRTISHSIENTVVNERLPVRLFSGFQRMSSFLPQIKRYERLADAAHAIYVFGVMDVSPPAITGVNYVPISEEHQLAREWFIVTETRDFFTALVTEELPGQDTMDPNRKFKGVWSFDEEMIGILDGALSSWVGLPPSEAPQRDQNDYRDTVEIMGNMIHRLTRDIADTKIS